MMIHCCGCGHVVSARLTDGKEIYPHRKDLYQLPFWKCDACGNYVGCHYKTENRIRPLGCIPTQAIREARKAIHAIIDPWWKNRVVSRKQVYADLNKEFGPKFRTARIRSIEEANKVLDFVRTYDPTSM